MTFSPWLDPHKMDTFESSANHRNTWTNYPADCYSTAADYYRPYGTARTYTFASFFATISVLVCFQLSPLCHGSNQVNMPWQIGRRKHRRISPTQRLTRHQSLLLMFIRISCPRPIRHQRARHLGSPTILPLLPKTIYTTLYWMHRTNSNNNSNSNSSKCNRIPPPPILPRCIRIPILNITTGVMSWRTRRSSGPVWNPPLTRRAKCLIPVWRRSPVKVSHSRPASVLSEFFRI